MKKLPILRAICLSQAHPRQWMMYSWSWTRFQLSCMSLRMLKAPVLTSHCIRRANDRERQSLTGERDLKNNSIRNIENDLHSMYIREKEISSQIRDKDVLEESISRMRKEFVDLLPETLSRLPREQGFGCPS